MERRLLGSTGESLSVVGCGAIVFCAEGPEFARETVARVVDAGINYFDVGPGYGEAEERMGPALEPYRDRVFLACKTGQWTKKKAAAELRESLQRLRTDHVDLYQLHGVTRMEDVDVITGPGGALEALIEARTAGHVRFLGFSAHTEEAALALMDRFPFDTILFPVNYVCWHQGHFGPRVVEAAREKEMGILALKALARMKWPDPDRREWPKAWYQPVASLEEARRGMRWTLSRPVTSCVSPGHAEFLWWMIEAAAASLAPMSPEEDEEMARASRGLDPIFRREPALA